MRVLELETEQFIVPDFDGGGLANLAPTVLHLLAPAAAHGLPPPLAAAVLPARLTEGIRTVVVVIADGLGHHQLLREIAAGNAPQLAELVGRAAAGHELVHYAPITSVFPTTTVAALGSVNSGVLPTEHGLLSYTLYLPEFQTVGEMIRWGPVNRRITFSDPEYGSSPEQFFWSKTVYARLHDAGVQRTFAVNPAHFSGTALTRMLHQSATYCGYIATSSLVPHVLRRVAESDEPTYVYAYWPTVDTISHIVGPQTEEHGFEVAAFDAMFGRLIARLPASGRTLVLLSADHGHVATGPEQQVSLDEHPELLGLLRVPPAGERRAVYLHARDGAHDEVLRYGRERLGEVAITMTRQEAIAHGFFGPRPLSEQALGRIGDVLVFPRGNLQLTATIQPPEGAPPLPAPPVFRGLHGGLTADEALVPLLAVRC